MGEVLGWSMVTSSKGRCGATAGKTQRNRTATRVAAMPRKPVPRLVRVDSVNEFVTAGQVPGLLVEACPCSSSTLRELGVQVGLQFVDLDEETIR